MTANERRSARLLFGEELALGEVDPSALERDDVAHAVRDMPIPSGLARRLQARGVRQGSLGYHDDVAAPLLAARRAVLGERAAGHPRVLLRLDAFPAPGVSAEALAEVHAVLRAAQVPYLVTVVAEDLDIGAQAVLRHLSDDGVALALRPRLTEDAAACIDAAAAELRSRALRADVVCFVPGELRAGDWAAAAQRYDVIAGGPEDVRRLGFHRTPLWRGDAVWLAAHPPLAGDVDRLVDGVRALIDEQAALWVPAVADLAALAADRAATSRLAAGLAGTARSWAEFGAAVAAARNAA